MQGKIIKSLSGFYEVHTEQGIFRCRARGVFRALGIKPLVGDNVEMEVTDTVSDPKEGNVTAILPRRNELLRPNVANVDQAMLVFAITHPVPSTNMLDRFLITVAEADLPAVLVFNKTDLATEEEKESLRQAYGGCGAKILFLSTSSPDAVSRILPVLSGKTTVLAGPSGVGKSTLINLLCSGAKMQTGVLSERIERGKNTTRHIELFPVTAGADGQAEEKTPETENPVPNPRLPDDAPQEDTSFVMDTPGFTSLWLADTKAEDLRGYYPEFEPYEGKCRFNGCMHDKEPDCAVRAAAESGEISKIRYDNYRDLLEEIRARKPVYRKTR